MRLTGVYFDLTDRITPKSPPRRRSVDDNQADRGRQTSATPAADGVVVLISVAKRLVPSAVRRNTVKRIVREAWRAAGRYPVGTGFDIGHSPQSPQSPQSTQGTSSGSARQNVQSVQGIRRSPAVDGKALSRVCLVRLKRYPGMRVKSGAALPPGTGEAAIRRSLRVDADQLFATFLSRPLPNAPGRRPHAPSGDGPPAVT